MSVFRESRIVWAGEDHIFTPSVAMLRRIAGEGINNLRLAHQCLVGGADPSELAVAMKHCLREAEVNVSDEECYGFLTSADQDGIFAFQRTYCEAVMPSIDLGKKPDAPGTAPKPRARKKPLRK